jgi:hypothetical protein
MADLAIFRAALARIGWSADAANAIIDEGFDSIDTIGLVDKSFLKNVCKTIRTRTNNPVHIPALNEYRLYGMHLWVSTLQSTGQPIDAANFKAAVGATYTLKVRKQDMERRMMA